MSRRTNLQSLCSIETQGCLARGLITHTLHDPLKPGGEGCSFMDQETWQVLTFFLYAVQTKGRYHVRVLVPCYRESLEIVARTSQAAWNARLPAGCDRTIYLCDDGKDPLKRKW